MSAASDRLTDGQFAKSAGALLAALRHSFLHDDDLENDLDAVLGESAGPIGIAGPKHRTDGHGLIRRRRTVAEEIPDPGSAAVAELGRCLTRSDRILGQLVRIARERMGGLGAPVPALADAVARAEGVRAGWTRPMGEFMDDRAHLRRLALAASDLLDVVSDDTGPLPDFVGGGRM
ncbi:hypothetical protein AB0O01_27965 [Streptomyces sp. NPDC093252]|uniref:hypothetical protein n=1 Tax=Streptomyces sp. NPDC093252 TaxID=3154980 RepID=UPI00341DE9EB